MFRSGHGVTGADRRTASAHELVTGFDATRRDDVAALAIDVLQQRQVGRPIRVVLQALDSRRDAVFVALEVDDR